MIALSDERRYDLPVALVCPEFTPTQAKEWIAGGDVPERVDRRRSRGGHPNGQRASSDPAIACLGANMWPKVEKTRSKP